MLCTCRTTVEAIDAFMPHAQYDRVAVLLLRMRQDVILRLGGRLQKVTRRTCGSLPCCSNGGSRPRCLCVPQSFP